MKNFKKLVSLLFALIICSAFCVTASAEEKWGDNVLNDHFTVIALPGDATGNGFVDLLDLVRMKKYTSDSSVEIDFEAADINGDGEINAQDLTMLKKALIGA